MKRLEILLLAVPISFALLLNTASSAEKPTVPAPINQSKKPENKTPEAKPPTVSTNPNTDPKQTSAQQQSSNWHSWFWPPIWSSWALVVIGAIAAVVALRTLNAIKQQTGAIALTAKATDESLKVYRPFIVVLEPVIESRAMKPNEPEVPKSATIRVRNDGLGPADILGFDIQSKVFTWKDIDDDPKAEDCFASEPTGNIIGSVIAKGCTIDLPPRWIDIYPTDLESMYKGNSRLGIYGILHYRGGPEKIYWTRFFYWHLVDSTPPQTVIAYTEDLNAHT